MQATSSKTRSIIITGANKGIGYAIIDSLLKDTTSYNIILTARSVENGQKALEELKKSHPQSSSQVSFQQLDLDDAKSQDAFVDWAKNTLGTYDILVDNAGIGQGPNPTNDWNAKMITTNFINTVSLTNKLLPYLAQDGKIIVISSTLGSLAFHKEKGVEILNSANSEEKLLETARKVNEGFSKDILPETLGFFNNGYHISKALLNAYDRFVLPQKLKGEQQVYTVCPGWCKTDLGGPNAFYPVERGAVTPVHLINLPFKASNELNGKFVRDEASIAWDDRTYGPR